MEPGGFRSQTPNAFGQVVIFHTLPDGLFCWGRGHVVEGMPPASSACSLGVCRAAHTAGACSLPVGRWPPAWAGWALWCHGCHSGLGGTATCPSHTPLPAASGRFGFCPPGGWASPNLPRSSQHTTHNTAWSCHLSPPGAICHPISGWWRPWGRRERAQADPRWGRWCLACYLAPGLSPPP